jgi:hypothetical protein
MIDSTGQLIVAPIYDGINPINTWNYSIVQIEAKIGLLDKFGKPLLSPRYDQIKVVEEGLFWVKEKGQNKLINSEEKILVSNCEDVISLNKALISFQLNSKWGVVSNNGNILLQPNYDEVAENDGAIFMQLNKKYGLASLKGDIWLHPIAACLKKENGLILYQVNNLWGAIHANGKPAFPCQYQHYTFLNNHLMDLVVSNKHFLFNLTTSQLTELQHVDTVSLFSDEYLLITNNQKLGIMDLEGKIVLSPVFEEVHHFSDQIFRAKKSGFWGLVKGNAQDVLPFNHDFIATVKNGFSLVKKGQVFGILDKNGNLVIPIESERIEIKEKQIKAYQANEALVIYYINENGEITPNEKEESGTHIRVHIKQNKDSSATQTTSFQAGSLEWFRVAQQEVWGLRNATTGEILLKPSFHYVKVLSGRANLPNLTLVGIHHTSTHQFNQTTYQSEMLFGFVSNEYGKLITDLKFIHVELEDFETDLPVARCIFSNGKHGLINRNGIVVAEDMTFIDQFQDNIARFAKNGALSGALETENKLGFLSEYLNHWLSPYYMIDYTAYDQDFSEEANLVCKNCSWGYINTMGKEVIPPAYEFALPFQNNIGLVKNKNKWGAINNKGKVVIPCQYDGIDFTGKPEDNLVCVYVKSNQFGLIDTLGNLALRPIYNDIGEHREGKIPVKKGQDWGFVNQKGEIIIPCNYEAVNAFHEGFAAAKLKGKWGYLDQEGKVAIDFQYSRVGDFSEGLAWIQLSDGIGYINKNKNIVFKGNFTRAESFKYGLARVMENGKWGLVDKTGDYVVRPRFINIEEFDENGLAIVSSNTDKWRQNIINTQGVFLTTESYTSIQAFSEGFAAVKWKDKFGYIDTNGKLVIEAIYSKVSPFKEGLAAVQLDGSCGYINAKGFTEVDFEYSKCLEFSQGRAVVYKNFRKAGLLDELGNYIIEPALNHLIDFREGRGLMRDQHYRFYYITEDADIQDGYYQEARKFQHGIAVVKMNNLWGIVNPQGLKIIPPKYDQIQNFEAGYAKIRVKGFHGLMKTNGSSLLPLEYEYIQYLGNELFKIESGEQIGYFHTQKGWIWQLSN